MKVAQRYCFAALPSTGSKGDRLYLLLAPVYWIESRVPGASDAFGCLSSRLNGWS